jgi:peroxiredoxin
MTATICLLTCAFALGQEDGGSWTLAPHLTPGLELVYSGTYIEKSLTPGVQFQRNYRLESTALVLDGSGRSWDVAFLTVLSLKTSQSDLEAEQSRSEPSSIRLQLGQVAANGRLRASNSGRMLIPIDAPPTIETGAFLELPQTAVRFNQSWEMPEDGRPPLSWYIAGREQVSGTTCLKLVGQQQSDDWDRPRADHTAWRRQDTVWVAPHLGIAFRVERVIERREPARRVPTHRTEVRYEIETRFQYPGKLFEDRRREIVQAAHFYEEAVQLWRDPARFKPQIDRLLRNIAIHLENHPGGQVTPYRKATRYIQSRLELASRGEPTADVAAEEERPLATNARVGEQAPDVLMTDLTDKSTVRLGKKFGRPIVMIFYNPATKSGHDVLLFGSEMYERYRGKVTVLALTAHGTAEEACRQHAAMQLPFPVLDGKGLQTTFHVDATPRLILLDSEGMIRFAVTGWGVQVPRDLQAELRNWLPRDNEP